MRPSLRWRLAACALLVGTIMAGCTTSTADNPTSAVPSSTASPSVVDTSSASPASSVPASPSPSVIDVSTPPTSPTTLDPEAQEIADRAAVEAAWNRFWDAALSVVRTPDSQRDALMSSVAVDPIRSEILTEARDAETQGLDRYGTITSHPYWNQSIDGGMTAVIEDCQDSSQSGMLDKSSNEKKTVGVSRNNTRGSLEKGPDGIWRVSNVFYLVDVPC